MQRLVVKLRAAHRADLQCVVVFLPEPQQRVNSQGDVPNTGLWGRRRCNNEDGWIPREGREPEEREEEDPP